MNPVPLLAMTPFDLDKNLGRAYNNALALLPEDGWACLMDHDMMFTTPNWYAQLQEAIAYAPQGTFTAVTNRIASPWQRAEEVDRKNNDVQYHRKVGQARLRRRALLDISDSNGFGGVIICLSKATWRQVGGFADGLYCVDHSLFYKLRALELPSYLIEGLYVYHVRGSSEATPPMVAPKVPGCPCARKVPAPTQRLALP